MVECVAVVWFSSSASSLSSFSSSSASSSASSLLFRCRHRRRYRGFIHFSNRSAFPKASSILEGGAPGNRGPNVASKSRAYSQHWMAVYVRRRWLVSCILFLRDGQPASHIVSCSPPRTPSRYQRASPSHPNTAVHLKRKVKKWRRRPPAFICRSTGQWGSTEKRSY